MAVLTTSPGLDPTNHKKSMHRQSVFLHCDDAVKFGGGLRSTGHNFSFAAALAESFLQAGEGLKHWAQRPSIWRQQAWLSPGSICRDVYPLCLKHPKAIGINKNHRRIQTVYSLPMFHNAAWCRRMQNGFVIASCGLWPPVERTPGRWPGCHVVSCVVRKTMW